MIRSPVWAALRVWTVSRCKQGAHFHLPVNNTIAGVVWAHGARECIPIDWGPERCNMVMLSMQVMMIKTLFFLAADDRDYNDGDYDDDGEGDVTFSGR